MTEQVAQIESNSLTADDARKCNSCGKYKALDEFGGKATCDCCRVKKAAERLKKRKCSETMEFQEVELCELRRRVETSESQVDELRLLLIRRGPAGKIEPNTPPHSCGCISDLEAVRAELHASQQTVAQLIREKRSIEQKLDILTAQASEGNTQQSQFDFDLVQQLGSHKQARTTIARPSPVHYDQPLFKYESATGQATLAGALGQGSAKVGGLLHATPCSGSPEDFQIEMEACLRHFVQPSWKIGEQMGQDTFTYLPQQLEDSSSNNSNSFSVFGTGAGSSTSDAHLPQLEEHPSSSDTMFSEVSFAAEDPASKFLHIEQVPLELQFDPTLENECSRSHCVGLGWLGAFSVFLCALRAVRFCYGTLQYPDSSNVPYIGTAILGLCATQVWWVPHMQPTLQPTSQRLMYLFSIGVWILATWHATQQTRTEALHFGVAGICGAFFEQLAERNGVTEWRSCGQTGDFVGPLQLSQAKSVL